MRKLDLYVSRLFLSSYAVFLLLFVGLFIMVDFFSRLDDLTEAGRKAEGGLLQALEMLAGLYLFNAPFVFHQTAPFLTLMAAMFTLLRLRRGNELVPMMAGGISLQRVTFPLFGFAGLTAVVMVASQQWLVPRIAREQLRMKAFFEGKDGGMMKNIGLKRDGMGNVFQASKYDRLRGELHDVAVWRRQTLSSGETILDREVLAERAAWRDGPSGRGWYLRNGRERLFRPEGPPVERPLDLLAETDLVPADLEMLEADRLHLSFTALNRLFHRNPDQRSLRVLLHSHITFPLSTLVLLLIGIPFVLRERHRSPVVGVGLCLILSGAYFTVDFLLRDLGNRGSLDPLAAAWLPLLLFGSLGVAAYDGMRT